MWTFVSQPGIECAPTAVEKQHPNHSTTKAFPKAILEGQAEGNSNANHRFGQEFGKTLSS